MNASSLISVVSECYTIGSKAIDLCSAWKHADAEVEKRIVIIEACWDRTKRQVNFMTRIDSAMDDEQRCVMESLLTQLSLSLSRAMSTLKTVNRRSLRSKACVPGLNFKGKAVWLWKKDALDTIISELEAWQGHFDSAWFLLVTIPNPIVDRELARAKDIEASARGLATVARNPCSVAAGLRNVLSPVAEPRSKTLFLPESEMQWRDIPFSDAKAGRRLSDKNEKWYIIDTIDVGPAVRVRDLARDVRTLATKLTQADPIAFGLLSCKGVMAISQQQASPVSSPQTGSDMTPVHPSSPSGREVSSFQFVFRIPDGMDALQSLRKLLVNSELEISLSRKVRIARELVKAVSYVHTFAFVHKNVRPESVLCFEDPESSRSHAFLVGFDAFRGASTGTMMGGDTRWDRNIYRHPHRQGIDPTEKYRMQHDIYSLGVCLLEIGIWEPLVEYHAGTPQVRFGKFLDGFQPSSEHQSKDTSGNTMAFQLKNYLVEQARTRLPSHVGDRYANVAISCLTCLDADNDVFGGLEVEENDDAVAIQFIEKVMMSLDEISV